MDRIFIKEMRALLKTALSQEPDKTIINEIKSSNDYYNRIRNTD